MHGGHAGPLVAAHDIGDVGYPAIAGIGIDDHRQRHCIDDLGGASHHLIGRDQADVGPAMTRRDCIARHVDGVEPGLADQHCAKRVMGSGDRDRAALRKQRPQAGARRRTFRTRRSHYRAAQFLGSEAAAARTAAASKRFAPSTNWLV